MILKKTLIALFLALFGTYAGTTLASPAASHSGATGIIVAQAQPDKPVDCKKTPTDPRCAKR